MIRVKKTRPVKVRRSTAFSRFLSRPVVRFGFAGFMSIIITFLLFIFMMYITQNFTKGSSIASQMLFDLNMVDMPEKRQSRRVRVQRPPEVADEPATQEYMEIPEGSQDAGSEIEQNTN